MADFIPAEMDAGFRVRTAVADGIQNLSAFYAEYLLVDGLADFLFQYIYSFGSQAAVVLVAVQLKHIDGLVVWAPCDIGEVAICRVAGFQIDGLSGEAVEYAYGHLV